MKNAIEKFITAKFYEISSSSLGGVTNLYLRAAYSCKFLDKQCSPAINNKTSFLALAPALADCVIRQYFNNKYPFLKNKFLPGWDMFFDVVGMHGFFLNNAFWLTAEITAKGTISDTGRNGLIATTATLAIASNAQLRKLIRSSTAKLIRKCTANRYGNWSEEERGTFWLITDFTMETIRGFSLSRGWILAAELMISPATLLKPHIVILRLVPTAAYGFIPGILSCYHAPHLDINDTNENQPAVKWVRRTNKFQALLSVIFYSTLLYFMTTGVESKLKPVTLACDVLLLTLNLLFICCKKDATDNNQHKEERQPLMSPAAANLGFLAHKQSDVREHKNAANDDPTLPTVPRAINA
jgi:hypothetical protein